MRIATGHVLNLPNAIYLNILTVSRSNIINNFNVHAHVLNKIFNHCLISVKKLVEQSSLQTNYSHSIHYVYKIPKDNIEIFAK